MKLSMWMIALWLEKDCPEVHIRDGQAVISGVRFFNGSVSAAPSLAYIGNVPGETRKTGDAAAVQIAHGRDFIVVRNMDPQTLMNEILTAIEFYSNWEKQLQESIGKEDALQRMIDISDGVFNQPSRIIDMGGNVLAISRKFGPDDVDLRWKKTYESGVVQLTTVGMFSVTADGEHVKGWSEQPRRYCAEESEAQKINYIGANIRVDNEDLAALYIQEHHTALTQAHCQLAAVLCGAIKQTLQCQRENPILRSKSSILSELLQGIPTTQEHCERLGSDDPATPMLLLVARSRHGNTPQVRKGSILTASGQFKTPNISCIHGEDNVSVVPAASLQEFIYELMTVLNSQHYIIGISLPFHGWNDIPTRYEQACFAAAMSSDVPGIYHCKDFAFRHLLKEFIASNQPLELKHPALLTLQLYDEKHNTDFYETLYYFLLCERSQTETIKMMQIPRNTLLYRLKRINELIGDILDDPEERTFILISYLMDQQDPSRKRSVPKDNRQTP